MRFRKIELIPLLFIICATLVLGGLGAWQLERLQWKNTMIASIDAAQLQAPLTDIPADTNGLEYRSVELKGTFHYNKTVYEIGGIQGESAGYFLLTPFTLADGRTLLVNRGFSPKNRETKPEGIQTVKGVIRPLRQQRRFSPANQPNKNLWFYEDLDAMAKIAGAPLLPVIVEEFGTRAKGVYPVPNDATKISDTLRNDHLGYAITWFSLMLIGLVMFGLYHRIPEKKA